MKFCNKLRIYSLFQLLHQPDILNDSVVINQIFNEKMVKLVLYYLKDIKLRKEKKLKKEMFNVFV